jgi:futalosine hydrolase
VAGSADVRIAGGAGPRRSSRQEGASVGGVIMVVAATERELSFVQEVETLCCGIGPIEAALATARALAERPTRAVLHIGIAGAVSLEPPSLVIGSEAIYCDIVDENAVMPRIERARPDPALVAAAQRALPGAQVLPIATCGRVGNGRLCEVEAMEGFAVLRAAELAAVPAVEVRAVSNTIDQSDRSLWRIDDALAVLAAAVPRLVEELQRAGTPGD